LKLSLKIIANPIMDNESTKQLEFLLATFDNLNIATVVINDEGSVVYTNGAFGMNIGGIESRHKLFDMAILYTLSNVLNAGVVYGAKNITTRERPDRSDNHSFPSGHASTAFVAAEFLHQEYKDKSIWISVGGYGIATLVSAARMYNNQHWVSDVVAGAGIGILSTKIAYWSYPYLQKAFRMKEKQFSTQMVPMYYDGKIGLNFVSTF
jgi:membrane-associated phospholipid phosphatase